VLTPGGKAHLGLATEHPCERAAPHASHASPIVQRIGVRRIVENRAANLQQSSILRHRDIQRNAGRAGDLIQDQQHDAAVAPCFVVFDGHAHGGENQFTQQVGDFEHPARFRQVATHTLVDVQRAHRHVATTGHLMSDAARNPQRPLRRQDVAGVIGSNRRDTRDRIQHLGALVGVARLGRARVVLVRQGGHWTRHILIVDAPRAARMNVAPSTMAHQ
jgi:hypothetical protein